MMFIKTVYEYILRILGYKIILRKWDKVYNPKLGTGNVIGIQKTGLVHRAIVAFGSERGLRYYSLDGKHISYKDNKRESWADIEVITCRGSVTC